MRTSKLSKLGVESWKDFLLGAGATAIVAWVMWPKGAAAMPELSEGQTYSEQLVSGQTIILRASVGDTINVTAPPGWGVPSSQANIPGFLEVQSTNSANETTTLKVTEGGQGQIQMTNAAGEVAVLSIEAS